MHPLHAAWSDDEDVGEGRARDVVARVVGVASRGRAARSRSTGRDSRPSVRRSRCGARRRRFPRRSRAGPRALRARLRRPRARPAAPWRPACRSCGACRRRRRRSSRPAPGRCAYTITFAPARALAIRCGYTHVAPVTSIGTSTETASPSAAATASASMSSTAPARGRPALTSSAAVRSSRRPPASTTSSRSTLAAARLATAAWSSCSSAPAVITPSPTITTRRCSAWRRAPLAIHASAWPRSDAPAASRSMSFLALASREVGRAALEHELGVLIERDDLERQRLAPARP